MADDWGDENETTTGKSFGINGSFNSKVNDNDGAEDDGAWGADTTTSNNENGYNGGGGGGGGGFRGGRGRGGGRGGGRGDRNGFGGGDRNGFGGDRNGGGDRNSNGFGGGEDRPRRGGGRGGGRGNFNNNGDGDRGSYNNKGDGDDGEKKPRELYIPPDPTDDENIIFGSGISSGINFDKYEKIPVKVSGQDAPSSITTFLDSGLREFLLTNIKKSGYTTPTPIQKTAIPIIMKNRDLMACAQTGSGKTAAFLLPIINDLLNQNTDLSIGKPQALIVAPTRELSSQIYEEARKFTLGSYIKVSNIYGGTGVKHQGDNIAKGCHILVATPGRLLDFVDRGFIEFEDTRFIVLDEADRMLDMGFKPAVEKIMSHPTRIPAKCQNLMFSATFPEDIQRLAGEFLNNYIFITIGIVGGACSDIEQNIYEVTRFEKRKKLTEILDEQDDSGGTMVFVETKRNADFLASLFSETKIPTTSIHGDRLQREREQALRDFKTGKMKVLIATSVAARGLDIRNVAHVVNYDLPKSIDEYVHRIGRTGRVGNRGKATSFYDPDQDSALASDLVRILKQAEKSIPDFLVNTGCDGNYANSQRQFGGRDVRRNNRDIDPFTGQGSAEPDALEPDETW